jgi:hypothetical protein
VLRGGFETIARSDGATPFEKALARLGVEITGISDMGEQSACASLTVVMQALTRVQSGPAGPVIAKVAKSAADASKTWSDTTGVLRKGLEVIAGSGQVSDLEKTAARFGVKVGTVDSIAAESSSRARAAVMDALSKVVTGPVSLVISQITFSAAEASKTWADTKNIQREGLNAILESQGATPEEKALAGLGVSVGTVDSIAPESAAAARSAVLKELKNPKGGPIGVALARAARSAAEASKTWADTKNVLRVGFQSVIDNQGATDLEKTLAKFGIAAGAVDSIAAESSCAARMPVMSALAAGTTGPMGAVLAQIALKSAGPSKTWDDTENILRAGFEALAGSPLTPAEQRSLAHKGLNVGSGSAEVVARRRLAVMEELAKTAGKEADLKKEVEEMAAAVTHGTNDTVELQEDHIKVAGVKLSRRPGEKEIA